MGGFINQKLPLINTNQIAPQGCYLSPLPVSLLGFEAHAQADGSVLCEWRTRREVNNKTFEVERSKDGETFESMVSIDGAGTSEIYHAYEWLDEVPHRGISYYRLKQIDVDGTFSYQPKVAVHILADHDELTYRAYPNPADDHFNLDLNISQSTQGELKIVNTKGQTLYSKQMDITQGSSTHRIACDTLKTGNYIVQLMTAIGESFAFSLVKK